MRRRWILPALAGLLAASVGSLGVARGMVRPPPVASVLRADPAFLLPPPEARLAEARTVEARLSLRSHELPADAPSVVVHAPAGASLERARLVVYLHGWEGCARAFLPEGPVSCRPGEAAVAGWGLGAQADAAGSQSILVVPQLAWRARSGNPGRFREPGFAEAWLQALVDEVLGPELGVQAIDELVLVAHSGGYLTALELLEAPGLPVRSVVLLDALYGGGRQVAAWAAAAPGRKAVSLYTPHPATRGQSALLAALTRPQLVVEEEPGDLEAAVARAQVVVSATPHPHGLVPERELARLLRGLGA